MPHLLKQRRGLCSLLPSLPNFFLLLRGRKGPLSGKKTQALITQRGNGVEGAPHHHPTFSRPTQDSLLTQSNHTLGRQAQLHKHCKYRHSCTYPPSPWDWGTEQDQLPQGFIPPAVSFRCNHEREANSRTEPCYGIPTCINRQHVEMVNTHFEWWDFSLQIHLEQTK